MPTWRPPDRHDRLLRWIAVLIPLATLVYTWITVKGL